MKTFLNESAANQTNQLQIEDLIWRQVELDYAGQSISYESMELIVENRVSNWKEDCSCIDAYATECRIRTGDECFCPCHLTDWNSKVNQP